jgi:hypothetical protein
MRVIIAAAALFLAAFTLVSFASSVAVTRVNVQTRSGILTHVYFETISGPSSSTPSTNTAQTQPVTSGSYSVQLGTVGYLWSPQFTSTSSISAGKWVIDLWGALGTSATQDIPITITNTQTTATPNPFQQKITWNPSTYTSIEAADLGNIRFYSDSSCTTPLYAWLESCTPTLSNTATSATAYVRLTSSISGNGGTITIYMAFLPTGTTYDGNYWGNAPNLSGTYGQYDNGANVFTFYDDFKGTTLDPKWTPIIGSSGASITVNNGLTVTTTSTASTAYAFVLSGVQTQPKIAETYTISGNSILGVSTTTNLNGFIAPYTGYSMDWYAGHDDIEYEASTGGTQLTSLTQSTFPAGIWQVTWSARRVQYFQDGAGNSYRGTYNGVAIANYRMYVGQSNGIISSSVFRWARMRAYPPNNVNPINSFGSLTTPVGTARVSLVVTDSSGNVVTTIASNVVTPNIGASKTQLIVTVSGSQANVPVNGYICLQISANSSPLTIYWGAGQPTNFQVPYRVLS